MSRTIKKNHEFWYLIALKWTQAGSAILTYHWIPGDLNLHTNKIERLYLTQSCLVEFSVMMEMLVSTLFNGDHSSHMNTWEI